MSLELLGVAGASFVFSAAGVGAFRRWAAGRPFLLDHPNARSSHVRPTPRGAGFAIVLAVVGAFLWTGPRELVDWALPALAACVVAGVSALDDIRPLASGLRLAIHLTCAAAAVAALGPVGGIPIVTGVAAVIWIVGLTNAYNFMDGIDGMAGAQGVVAGIATAAAAWQAGAPGLAIVAAAAGAACAGFLLYNWSPAAVFMGDVGSAFLGFLFGVLAVRLFEISATASLAVALSLWPFIFDTAFTLVRRMTRRENLFVSHRSHLYQRLVIAGWPHARVTLIYACAAALGPLFVLTPVGELQLPLAAGAVILMAVGLWATVRWRESSVRSARPATTDARA